VAALNHGDAPGGDSGVLSTLREGFAAHTEAIRSLGDRIETMMSLQPYALKHALRGAR